MTNKTFYLALLLLAVACVVLPLNHAESQSLPPYKNPNLPVQVRVDDLVSRLTLEEKIGQMMNATPAIERLGVPAHDYWNEALHGVARSGVATVFPQAIGLAATWDTKLMYDVADVISTEARAKHHEYARNKQFGRYQGLTFWSPNINIFRDPRWGRGQETYGEDPYLTGQMGVQFVRGLQGNDPRYFKVIATPKHYAVHSGPEPERHAFDAVAYERDLRETYLPAFRATILDGKAFSVMCAYNRTNGEPACANKQLMKDILKTRKTVQYYVWYNLGMMVLSLIIGFFMAFAYNPEVAVLIAKVNNDAKIIAITIGVFILTLAVFLSLFWLFYRLIYGILLKRLYTNYKELKKIDL